MKSEPIPHRPHSRTALRRARAAAAFGFLMVMSWQVAASPISSGLTCKASRDAWSVVSSPLDRKVSCSVRCLLHDDQGQQDSVVCSPQLVPGSASVPICEGFLLGKNWVSAELVSVSCAVTE